MASPAPSNSVTFTGNSIRNPSSNPSNEENDDPSLDPPDLLLKQHMRLSKDDHILPVSCHLCQLSCDLFLRCRLNGKEGH